MSAASVSKFRWPPRNASAEEILRWSLEEFGDKIDISTSFQSTGMVILDMAACLTGGDVQVFSLDTGRIHQETYDLIEQVRRRYGIEIEMLTPDSHELTRMLTLHGPNLF
jgi:3'-phosphoadenosine 5'-phosphosulfate sulfotransferase (PAPS reductase)/FAD synthetase